MLDNGLLVGECVLAATFALCSFYSWVTGFSSSVVPLCHVHIHLLFHCVLDAFSILYVVLRGLQYIFSYNFHCSTNDVACFLRFDHIDVKIVTCVAFEVIALGEALVCF